MNKSLLYALLAGAAMYARTRYPDYVGIIDSLLVTLGVHRLEDTRDTVKNGKPTVSG